jgi:hypothetical protein
MARSPRFTSSGSSINFFWAGGAAGFWGDAAGCCFNGGGTAMRAAT